MYNIKPKAKRLPTYADVETMQFKNNVYSNFLRYTFGHEFTITGSGSQSKQFTINNTTFELLPEEVFNYSDAYGDDLTEIRNYMPMIVSMYIFANPIEQDIYSLYEGAERILITSFIVPSQRYEEGATTKYLYNALRLPNIEFSNISIIAMLKLSGLIFNPLTLSFINGNLILSVNQGGLFPIVYEVTGIYNYEQDNIQ